MKNKELLSPRLSVVVVPIDLSVVVVPIDNNLSAKPTAHAMPTVTRQLEQSLEIVVPADPLWNTPDS